MYIFKYLIPFFIITLKNPTNNFNINTYILFTVGNITDLNCGVKLRHNAPSANKECHIYLFNRISHLWNSLPIIDLNLSINIKSKSKSYFWQHSITSFDPDNVHKLHYLSPCCCCITTSLFYKQLSRPSCNT